MANELIPANLQTSIAKIDEIVGKYGLSKLREAGSHMERMVLLAEGMQQLRGLITGPLLDKVMALQGSKLGYRTDKDNTEKGYGPEVVKDVMVEATLRGAHMVGNEVNIIASGCYLTKEYFERATREFPGVTNIVVELAVPTMKEGGALVAGWVRYELNGEPKVYERYKFSDEKDMRIAVRVNSGMGADAVLGKAKRKLLAGLFEQLSGMSVVEGEVDEGDIIDVPAVKRSSESKLNDEVDAAKKGKGLLP